MRNFAIILLAALGFVFGAGAAHAAPGDWANAPGYTGSVSSGLPAGTLLESREIPTPESVEVPSRSYILTYEDGTGQKTNEILIVPIEPYEGVRPILTNVPATDSLDPAKAPSRQYVESGEGVGDVSEEWLEGGGSVLIPDSYGDDNPTYAGLNNGIRVKNGMLAAQEHVGVNAPIVCRGFSGGGLDCGRVAEDTTVYVPNYSGAVISGAPANMQSVVDGAMGHEQSGLISTAAMPGVYRSLSDEKKAAIDPNIRPSAKLLFQILNLGGSGSELATYMGLVGIQADWLFVPGSFNDPEVQSVIANAGLGNSTPDEPVLVAGNHGDPWMVWHNNGKVLAEDYTNSGADVSVAAANKQGWPGHTDIGTSRQINWMNRQLPEGSKLVETTDETTPMDVVSDVIAPVVNAAMNAVGSVVEDVVPQISQDLDAVVTQTLDAADDFIVNGPPEVPSAPPVNGTASSNEVAPAPVVSQPVDNVATIRETITTHVGEQNAPIAGQIVDQVVAAHPQAVDFINSLPIPLPLG